MSANERHGKRDGVLSAKHRRWGLNVPAVDIDFLLEYDNRKACAIIEYRHYNGSIRTDSANLLAQIDLANRASLPMFVVQYRYANDDGTLWKEHTVDDPAFFRIIPCNDHAEKLWLTQDVDSFMTEREYVSWLYQLRGRVMPTNLNF